MKGDYYRYMAEITPNSDRQSNLLNSSRKQTSMSIVVVAELAEESHRAYKEGFDIASNQMPVIHPMRLGLVLNYSVFYYEILNEPDAARRLAKQVCSI